MNSLAMFEFTEEDLKSNQRGFISPAQKETIKNFAKGIRSSQSGGLKFGVFFLFFALCLMLGMFLSVESYRSMLLTDPTILIMLCLTGFVVLGIFGLSMYGANRRANRLLNSELKKVEGVVVLDETHSSKVGSAYYVMIGKIKFAFPEDVSGTFEEGKPYRIFYCETSMFKYMLSFEKLG